MQMYFPFPTSGKIFLYTILMFITFWSMLPIKCHTVVLYWNTNIYSLMPVTVMVLSCVNTAATVCYSLCLLGCSQDWAVAVVCDDARKLFGMFHHWLEFDTWLINSFARTSYVYFFAYCNWTTIGLIGNSLCEVLWNQVHYCDDACIGTLLWFVTFLDPYLLDRL